MKNRRIDEIDSKSYFLSKEHLDSYKNLGFVLSEELSNLDKERIDEVLPALAGALARGASVATKGASKLVSSLKKPKNITTKVGDQDRNQRRPINVTSTNLLGTRRSSTYLKNNEPNTSDTNTPNTTTFDTNTTNINKKKSSYIKNAFRQALLNKNSSAGSIIRSQISKRFK